MHASWTSPFPCGQHRVAAAGCRRGRVYALWSGPRAVRARELAQRERRSLPCLGAARRSLPRSSDSLCRRCGSVRRGERRHGISLTLRCGLAEVGEVALESESDDKKQWRDGDASSAGVSAGGAAQLLDRVVPSWSAGRRRFLRRQLASARRVCWLDARVANLHGQQLPVSPVAGGACARTCVVRSRPCGGATTR